MHILNKCCTEFLKLSKGFNKVSHFFCLAKVLFAICFSILKKREKIIEREIQVELKKQNKNENAKLDILIDQLQRKIIEKKIVIEKEENEICLNQKRIKTLEFEIKGKLVVIKEHQNTIQRQDFFIKDVLQKLDTMKKRRSWFN